MISVGVYQFFTARSWRNCLGHQLKVRILPGVREAAKVVGVFMVVDLVRLIGLLRMPSLILKVCELSRSITCRLFMLKGYLNRKGPTTADAMIINVHPFWVHAFDLFIICHLLNVYHMMVLIFQQYAFHLAFQSSPRHSIDRWRLPSPINFLMHLSILQVYYEPLDITGPALSSNWIVWCRP